MLWIYKMWTSQPHKRGDEGYGAERLKGAQFSSCWQFSFSVNHISRPKNEPVRTFSDIRETDWTASSPLLWAPAAVIPLVLCCFWPQTPLGFRRKTVSFLTKQLKRELNQFWWKGVEHVNAEAGVCEPPVDHRNTCWRGSSEQQRCKRKCSCIIEVSLRYYIYCWKIQLSIHLTAKFPSCFSSSVEIYRQILFHYT